MIFELNSNTEYDHINYHYYYTGQHLRSGETKASQFNFYEYIKYSCFFSFLVKKRQFKTGLLAAPAAKNAEYAVLCYNCICSWAVVRGWISVLGEGETGVQGN